MKLPPHGSDIAAVAFSPDENRIATADSDGVVRISRLLPRGQSLVDLARQRVH